VGSQIATGGVRGVDPPSGLVPVGLDAQVRLMFDNLVTIIEAAGGTAGTIAKVTVWAADRNGSRDAINENWIRLFPDESSWPARHVVQSDLPGGMLVQCEALALALGGNEGTGGA
jgi:2-iminobutanoate/2-iminopropanoate deaminase